MRPQQAFLGHGPRAAPLTPRQINPSAAFMRNLAPTATIIRQNAPAQVQQGGIISQADPVAQVSQASNDAGASRWYTRPVQAVIN